MATLVSEVTSTDPSLKPALMNVVSLFCRSQSAFQVEIIDLPRKLREATVAVEHDGANLSAPRIFSLLRSAVQTLRGSHDRIVVFTTSRLDGAEYGNIFSSVEEDDQGAYTGFAVVTTCDVELLNGGLPIEGYLFQQLVSINLRWVVGHKMMHETPPKDCLLHKRIDKRLIALSMREMRLCDACRESARSLDDHQWQSLKDIMHDVSNSTNSNDPKEEMEKLLARRMPRKYGPWDWRDPEKTLMQDLIDNWRRFRSGRARYTVAGLLAVAGVKAINPPWWQSILERLLGITTNYEPSSLQQIIGFLVVILAVYLLVGTRSQPKNP